MLIAYGRVHAIIITFGTANLFQFVGLQIFGSNTVNGIPRDLKVFGIGAEGRFLGLPLAFLITVVLAALAWVYLRHTAGGRHFYAIGGDAHAARLAGRPGAAPADARLRHHRRRSSGWPPASPSASGTSTVQQNIGSGIELAAIAAVVIGGTSIMGGRGSVLGTVLGALLVQTVSTGVTQLQWPSQLSDLFVGIAIVIAVGADLLRERARKNKSGGRDEHHRPHPHRHAPQATADAANGRVGRQPACCEPLLTQRSVLLVVLLVAVLATFMAMDANGYLTGPYDGDTLAAALINLVPLVMLALAEMLVIVSGRGGIDLSIGSTVSLDRHGLRVRLPDLGSAAAAWRSWWRWSPAALCGAVNGFLIAYLGFPALIATLATYYAYKSIALVINDQKPVTGDDDRRPVRRRRPLGRAAGDRREPADIPLGVFYFLLPTVVVVYLIMARTTYGRRLFAIGTNDVAGHGSPASTSATPGSRHTCWPG